MGYTDPTLKDFIIQCEKRKIPYWLYVYLNNGNELAQTKRLVDVCAPLVGKYFVGYALDIEEGNSQKNCISALNWLKDHCKRQMIYVPWGLYQLGEYRKLVAERPESCAWWEPRYGLDNGTYNSKYPCHAGVELHQYTEKGTAAGVSDPGKIDMNMITGKTTERWFCGLEEVKTVNVELNVLCRDVECPEVLAWKKMLIASGYSKGITMTDRFGSKAEERTKEWQKANGLYADGIVGAKSWHKMLFG